MSISPSILAEHYITLLILLRINSVTQTIVFNIVGANDIIMSIDPKNKDEGKGSLDTLRRKYFLPKDLEHATPEEIWKWWQKRGQQENLLQNAIISSKVCEEFIFIFLCLLSV